MSTGATQKDYDGLVSGLYRAAMGAEPLHQALQNVCDQLGGDFCQLIAIEKPTGRLALSLHSTHAPMEGALDYMREYHRHDPHLAHAAALTPGRVFHTSSLVSDQEAQHHLFYRQFWATYNVRYLVGGKVDEDANTAVFFGVSRNARAGDFQTSSDVLLQRLMLHLREAYAIHLRVGRLRTQADSARLVIDQTARPILLLGPDRFIVHANNAAWDLLRQSDVVISRHGFLGCRDSNAEAALARGMYELDLEQQTTGQEKAHDRTDRRAVALRDLQGNPVPVCLWALRPQETMAAFGDTPRAMLMLPTAAAQVQADPMVLAAGFDLTPAEGRMLAALVQSLTIQEAANSLGISFHTARSHLHSIFEKTGVRTQKELMHQVRELLDFTWRPAG